MKNFLAVVAFSLATIGLFAGFSNFGIPQIRPEPPPVEEELDIAAMSVDQFIAVGKRIVDGKGTCSLCHNPVGQRAPLLDKVGQAAVERLADPRYEGTASDVKTYLYESLVEPSAYVVAGFGKTGTNDTVSPMPNVLTGSIGLAEAEVRAVVAYLQAASGVEVTMEVPAGAGAAVGDEEAGEARRHPVDTAEEAIAEFACGACHMVAGEEGEVGPNLTRIGATRDKEYLRRAILDPNAEITQGFEADLMPADYGEQLYAKELEVLVDYLAGLK